MEEQQGKKKNKGLIAALVILVILIVMAGAALFLVNYYYGRSNFVSDSDVQVNLEADNTAETLDAEQEQAVQQQLAALVDDETANADYVYNVLLIGSDTRTGGSYGNSDAMILISVNTKQQKVHMISFMRDLYANISGVGVRKLNSAYAIGGGPLLVQTIEENYKVDIDNYAAVNFDGLETIIDLVGGIELEVTTDEAGYLNMYLDELCALKGVTASDYYIAGGGVCHLNGLQATAYARIRYIGSDYERTSRQRKVLEQVMGKAKQLDVGTIATLIDQVLPLVTHNIDTAELVSLISQVPSYLSYELEMDRVPYDGLFTSQNEILIPDFEQTIARLQQTLYGEE